MPSLDNIFSIFFIGLLSALIITLLFEAIEVGIVALIVGVPVFLILVACAIYDFIYSGIRGAVRDGNLDAQRKQEGE